MTALNNANLTALLHRWRAGDSAAFAALSEQVYDQLYQRAQRLMQREGRHSFSSTDLVNELFLKLPAEEGREWRDRGHFFSIAAIIMRNILVNHAEAKQALKRGGDRVRAPAEVLERTPDLVSDPEQIILLDRGLSALAQHDARAAEIFEQRHLVGLDAHEIGVLFEMSPSTVRRDLTFARHWLARYIREGL